MWWKIESHKIRTTIWTKACMWCVDGSKDSLERSHEKSHKSTRMFSSFSKWLSSSSSFWFFLLFYILVSVVCKLKVNERSSERWHGMIMFAINFFLLLSFIFTDKPLLTLTHVMLLTSFLEKNSYKLIYFKFKFFRRTQLNWKDLK